jgi:hypothetical protein
MVGFYGLYRDGTVVLFAQVSTAICGRVIILAHGSC